MLDNLVSCWFKISKSKVYWNPPLLSLECDPKYPKSLKKLLKKLYKNHENRLLDDAYSLGQQIEFFSVEKKTFGAGSVAHIKCEKQVCDFFE